MPTYMDVHDLPGVKAEDVAKAHEADVRVQGQYGVDYKHYWVDEDEGKVFCLVDAPDRDARPSRGPWPRGPHAVRGRAGRLIRGPDRDARFGPGPLTRSGRRGDGP